MQFQQRLSSRNSHARLQSPAPNSEQVLQAVTAALRAPDHAWLRPQRFIVLEGEQRLQLARAFYHSEDQLTPERQSRLDALVMRAPMILIALASVQAHAKVPAEEQRITAALALGYAQLVFDEQGFASLWRTGELAYDPRVHSAMGLASHEQIVGFLYVGTAQGEGKRLPTLDANDFLRWGLA